MDTLVWHLRYLQFLQELGPLESLTWLFGLRSW